MSPKACISVLLLICFSLTLADDAQAWPRLLRRRSRSTSGGGTGNARVAAKTDQASANYDKLSVYYLYERAYAPEVAFADRIRVFLQVQDREVMEAQKPLVAEVKITDLTDPDTTHTKWCPVSLEPQPDSEYQVGTFDVTNAAGESILQGTKVYRLFVSLHRRSKEYGKQSVLGRVPSPYYVATSGDTALDLARQQIAMRGFREWYYRGFKDASRVAAMFSLLKRIIFENFSSATGAPRFAHGGLRAMAARLSKVLRKSRAHTDPTSAPQFCAACITASGRAVSRRSERTAFQAVPDGDGPRPWLLVARAASTAAVITTKLPKVHLN